MASELLVDLRCRPLTPVMVLLSAWWVKDLVAVAVAAWLRVRRRRAPWASGVVAVATLSASLGAGAVKNAFDRPRPYVQGLWTPLGDLPSSSSMPSGHAATVCAAAVALALLAPAARWFALALAVLVCVSRVYLGVHFASDVVAGAVIGVGVGWGGVAAGRRALGECVVIGQRGPRLELMVEPSPRAPKAP